MPVLIAWSDNGSEMTALDTRKFMALMAITQHHGRPGTPRLLSAHIQSFFSHLKGDWPHLTTIRDPAVLDDKLARVRREYNTVRLHAAVGYVTPDDEHHGRGPAIRRARHAGTPRTRQPDRRESSQPTMRRRATTIAPGPFGKRRLPGSPVAKDGQCNGLAMTAAPHPPTGPATALSVWLKSRPLYHELRNTAPSAERSASSRRPQWSASVSSAFPWPFESSPSLISSIASSGSSSRRTVCARSLRLRPRRRARSAVVTCRSSRSDAIVRASSITVRSSRATSRSARARARPRRRPRSSTSAGIVGRPAIYEARQRRSPAISWYPPAERGWTMIGCSTPRSRWGCPRDRRPSRSVRPDGLSSESPPARGDRVDAFRAGEISVRFGSQTATRPPSAGRIAP